MKYMVIILWLLGLALIAFVGVLLSRRADRSSLVRRVSDRLPTSRRARRGTLEGVATLVAVSLAGAAVTFTIMLALGAAWVVHHGATIDQPIYRFTIDHQVHGWVRVMARLTRIGNTWTTWGAALVAAAVLAAFWPARRRWIPPVALVTAIVVDHYATLAIRHVFERVGPPNSPHGTYPSGGCERVVLFYGLIAYLAWRQASGRRTSGIWAGVGVAMLAFNEAYSRSYLTLHWFTDAASGVLYGVLMLLSFTIAVRIVAGPVRRTDDAVPMMLRRSLEAEPAQIR
jgi:membrane-associated phospholipid phosphatase